MNWYHKHIVIPFIPTIVGTFVRSVVNFSLLEKAATHDMLLNLVSIFFFQSLDASEIAITQGLILLSLDGTLRNLPVEPGTNNPDAARAALHNSNIYIIIPFILYICFFAIIELLTTTQADSNETYKTIIQSFQVLTIMSVPFMFVVIKHIKENHRLGD